MTNNKIQLKNGQEAVLAEYKQQKVREYRGNPLIEALPKILSDAEVASQLTVYPNIIEEERNYPSEVRMHCIQRLFQYFQPFPIHLKSYEHYCFGPFLLLFRIWVFQETKHSDFYP